MRSLTEARQAEKNQQRQYYDQNVSDHGVLLSGSAVHARPVSRASALAVFICNRPAFVVDYFHNVLHLDPHATKSAVAFFIVLSNSSPHSSIRVTRVKPTTDFRGSCSLCDLFRTRFEFRDPRPRQSSLQNPAFNQPVADHDPQHCLSSRPRTREMHMSCHRVKTCCFLGKGLSRREIGKMAL